MRLNVSGRIGAFYTGTTFLDSGQPQNFRGLGGARQGGVTNTSAVSGNQFASKRDSASWQNLMNLFTIYRNNGLLYDLIGGSEAHQWVGMISIVYDQWTYTGQFENFSYGYTEQNSRGGIEFTFDFIASFVTDAAQRDFQVSPLRSPTPSPSDPLWANPNKASLSRGTLRGNRLTRQPSSTPPQSPIADPNAMAILRR